MPQHINIMLVLVTECQKWPCYLVRIYLSLVLHVDVTLMGTNLESDMLCRPCDFFWTKHSLNTRNLFCINWLTCLMGRYRRNLFHLLCLLLKLCYCIWENSHTAAVISLHLAVFCKILTSVWLSLVWSFKSDSWLSVRCSYIFCGN